MYVVFGDEVLDSLEVFDVINEKTNFVVEKDLTKSTKREDVLAYKISIDVSLLNDLMKEKYDCLDDFSEDELFDEYMNFCDDLGSKISDFIENDESIVLSRAYKWDNSDDTIKSVVAICHFEVGKLKLSDVVKRLISQVD